MPAPPQSQLPAPRDPALDGLRGLAILLVFLFHYGGGLRAHNPLVRALGYLTQAGWMGVDLFFALSGFLITGLLANSLLNASSDETCKPNHKHALRSFYARRALRILPLYFAALLACSIAALASGARLDELKPVLVYAAFLQNMPPLLNAALQTPPPLPAFHLWSLAVEEQFYILWPFALLAARTPRRALHLCVWTFALSCLFRALLFGTHLIPYATANSLAVFLPTRAGALALGSALALYHRLPASEAKRAGERPVFRSLRGEVTSQSRLLIITAAALAVISLTAAYTHTFLLNNRPAFVLILPATDLLCAAVLALALHPNALRRTLATPALTFLGRISYGFYVLHILLEPFFDRLGTVLTHSTGGFAYQTARLLVAFPFTLGAAWLSFTFLEGPFLRLKRRFPQRGNGSCIQAA